jgi:transcriptional regulator with XRE-family HTH domain
MVNSAGSGEPECSESLREFGAVVRVFRERAGLTRESLAPLVRYSVETVASIERGRRFPSSDFIERAEEELDAFGVLRAAARHLTRRPGLAAWFRQWARLEPEAINLCTYECRLIPGLLQSEGYARAVFDNSVPPLADEQLEAQVTARLERQHVLRDKPNTAFSFIIEEALFMRRLGGIDVTRVLFDHMLRYAVLRNVEIQIMPMDQRHHAGLDGPMQLLETPEHQWLAYSEGQRHSQLISDRKDVSVLLHQYAKLRSQALTPEDSLSLLKRMRGTL